MEIMLQYGGMEGGESATQDERGQTAYACMALHCLHPLCCVHAHKRAHCATQMITWTSSRISQLNQAHHMIS